MILSMTGYGKSVVVYNGKKINVEIKSLNSKALDLSTRIAPLYREKEMEIRQAIQTKVIRGKVDFSIWIEKDATTDATTINTVLAKNYCEQIKNVAAECQIPLPGDWFLSLLRMPDVMSKVEIETLSDEEWTVARKAIDEAIDALVAFRQQEGAALQKKFGEKKFGDKKFGDRKFVDKPFKPAYKRHDDKLASYPKFNPEKQTGEMRLNRFIAQSGICSRREADDFITAGVVSCGSMTSRCRARRRSTWC